MPCRPEPVDQCCQRIIVDECHSVAGYQRSFRSSEHSGRCVNGRTLPVSTSGASSGEVTWTSCGALPPFELIEAELCSLDRVVDAVVDLADRSPIGAHRGPPIAGDTSRLQGGSPARGRVAAHEAARGCSSSSGQLVGKVCSCAATDACDDLGPPRAGRVATARRVSGAAARLGPCRPCLGARGAPAARCRGTRPRSTARRSQRRRPASAPSKIIS